jgi:hypothetical protein
LPAGKKQLGAGVVVGFGGIAGHIYRRSPGDHRGYLAQLAVPHEVAAVTACMAVERGKFEAVGVFDFEPSFTISRQRAVSTAIRSPYT